MARWLRRKMAAAAAVQWGKEAAAMRGKAAEAEMQWGKEPAAARGKVAAAAKLFFERQRNESRVGGGPHGDLL